MVIFTVLQGFHFVTLEHYYIGELILGRINGVSEGSVFVISLWLVSAALGNDFWLIEVGDGSWLGIEGLETLTLGETCNLLSLPLSVLIALTSMFKVVKTVWYPKENQARQPQLLPLLGQYAFVAVWGLIWLLTAEAGSSPIRDQETQFDHAFQAVHYFLFYLLIVYQSLYLMICQSCSRSFQAYNFVTSPILVGLSLLLIASLFQDLNFKIFVGLATGFLVIILSTFIGEVGSEITSILDIEVFYTKQSRQIRLQR